MAMSSAAIKTCSILRRAYAAAAAASIRAPAATAVETAGAETGVTAKKEVFWMRDPKTGCWMPENRFDEVDPAEVRAKLLVKK